MNKLTIFLKLMRPRQWFKSFYIIIGAIPAILLLPPNPMLILVLLPLGILNLILIQGVAYVINDIADTKEDRKHIVKKLRPIASGKVSKREGIAFALFLLFAALLLASYLDMRIVFIDLLLLFVNLIYSLRPFRLKDRFFIDILAAALNFPLRVMAGWFLFEPYNEARLALSYQMTSFKLPSGSIQYILFNLSPKVFNISIRFSSVTLSFITIMLVTYFLACFLLAQKRLAEKIWLKKAEDTRKSLKYYNVTTLKTISLTSAIIVLLSFILFALSFKAALIFLTPLLAYTILWYYKLTFVKNSPVMYPEMIFTKMPEFIILLIISIVVTILILIL